MSEAWRVYLRRDGRTERTIDDVYYLAGRLVVYVSVKFRHIYEITDVMPATREAFADFSHVERVIR